MRWFELPDSYSIDLDRIRSEIKNLTWLSYGEDTRTPGAKGYHGIGLTCRADSPRPELDALLVYQDLRPDIKPNAHSFNWQEMDQLTPNAQGYLKEVLFSLGLAPGKARLAKLDSGSKIPPHRDDYCQNITRIHWPIQTDKKNFFNFYDEEMKLVERVNMREGRVYAVDPNWPHSFQNYSKVVDRIHLIINVNMDLLSFYQFVTSGKPCKKLNEITAN